MFVSLFIIAQSNDRLFFIIAIFITLNIVPANLDVKQKALMMAASILIVSFVLYLYNEIAKFIAYIS